MFHEHLAESLLRVDFRKTKDDPDLWMVDTSLHYEYFATYVHDFLIWSKDTMAQLNTKIPNSKKRKAESLHSTEINLTTCIDEDESYFPFFSSL